MASTIARLCPAVADKLQLRRKFKTSQDGRISRWWFLIRGDECVLTELEMWETVSAQTSWRLEDCLKYIEPNEQSSPLITVRKLRSLLQPHLRFMQQPQFLF